MVALIKSFLLGIACTALVNAAETCTNATSCAALIKDYIIASTQCTTSNGTVCSADIFAETAHDFSRAKGGISYMYSSAGMLYALSVRPAAVTSRWGSPLVTSSGSNCTKTVFHTLYVMDDVCLERSAGSATLATVTVTASATETVFQTLYVSNDACQQGSATTLSTNPINLPATISTNIATGAATLVLPTTRLSTTTMKASTNTPQTTTRTNTKTGTLGGITTSPSISSPTIIGTPIKTSNLPLITTSLSLPTSLRTTVRTSALLDTSTPLSLPTSLRTSIRTSALLDTTNPLSLPSTLRTTARTSALLDTTTSLSLPTSLRTSVRTTTPLSLPTSLRTTVPTRILPITTTTVAVPSLTTTLPVTVSTGPVLTTASTIISTSACPGIVSVNDLGVTVCLDLGSSTTTLSVPSTVQTTISTSANTGPTTTAVTTIASTSACSTLSVNALGATVCLDVGLDFTSIPLPTTIPIIPPITIGKTSRPTTLTTMTSKSCSGVLSVNALGATVCLDLNIPTTTPSLSTTVQVTTPSIIIGTSTPSTSGTVSSKACAGILSVNALGATVCLDVGLPTTTPSLSTTVQFTTPTSIGGTSATSTSNTATSKSCSGILSVNALGATVCLDLGLPTTTPSLPTDVQASVSVTVGGASTSSPFAATTSKSCSGVLSVNALGATVCLDLGLPTTTLSLPTNAQATVSVTVGGASTSSPPATTASSSCSGVLSVNALGATVCLDVGLPTSTLSLPVNVQPTVSISVGGASITNPFTTMTSAPATTTSVSSSKSCSGILSVNALGATVCLDLGLSTTIPQLPTNVQISPTSINLIPTTSPKPCSGVLSVNALGATVCLDVGLPTTTPSLPITVPTILPITIGGTSTPSTFTTISSSQQCSGILSVNALGATVCLDVGLPTTIPSIPISVPTTLKTTTLSITVGGTLIPTIPTIMTSSKSCSGILSVNALGATVCLDVGLPTTIPSLPTTVPTTLRTTTLPVTVGATSTPTTFRTITSTKSCAGILSVNALGATVCLSVGLPTLGLPGF